MFAEKGITVLCLFLSITAIYSNILLPTISNSSGDYFIASQSNRSFDLISCTASHCFVACDVSYGCYGVTININNSQTISIKCENKSSCVNTTVTVIGNILDTFNIHCFGNNTCNKMSIILSSTISIDELIFICNGENVCSNMNSMFINTSNVTINSLSLNCNSTSSCSNMNMDLSLIYSINYLDMYCEGYYACYQILLNAIDTKIYSMNIDCSIDFVVCYYISVFGVITHDVSINCASESGCERGTFWFTLKEYAMVDIICNNPYNTTWRGYNGACRYANYQFYPYDTMYLNPSDRTNNVTIFCNSYDCRTTSFNLNSMNYVIVYCDATSSCYQTDINGEETNKLQIECNDQSACNQLDVKCPDQVDNACKITCSDYENSCSNMDITVSDNFNYGYLDLNCPEEPNRCDVSVRCWYKDSIYLVYDDTTNDYVCSVATFDTCCPYIAGGILTPCNNDEECVVNCSITNCYGVWFNTTNANTLTLQCSDDNSCQGSIFVCPNGGCTINCDAYQSCVDTVINYYGTINDKATVLLECRSSTACDSITINTNNVYNVTLNINEYNMEYVRINANYADNILVKGCSGNEENSGWRYTATGCERFRIDGTYANQIDIICDDYYGCGYFSVWGEHATHVNLKASGHKAFYDSNLFVQNAEYVQIYCASDNYDDDGYDSIQKYPDYACIGNDFYVPSNTTFDCYGLGCYLLDTMLFNINNSASDIIFNINGCGECDSIDECIDNINVNCQISNKNQTYHHSSIDGGICASTSCNCNHLATQISENFINDDYDPLCYGTPDQVLQDWDVIIISTSITAVTLIMIFTLYLRFKGSNIRTRKANMQNTYHYIAPEERTCKTNVIHCCVHFYACWLWPKTCKTVWFLGLAILIFMVFWIVLLTATTDAGPSLYIGLYFLFMTFFGSTIGFIIEISSCCACCDHVCLFCGCCCGGSCYREIYAYRKFPESSLPNYSDRQNIKGWDRYKECKNDKTIVFISNPFYYLREYNQCKQRWWNEMNGYRQCKYIFKHYVTSYNFPDGIVRIITLYYAGESAKDEYVASDINLSYEFSTEMQPVTTNNNTHKLLSSVSLKTTQDNDLPPAYGDVKSMYL